MRFRDKGALGPWIKRWERIKALEVNGEWGGLVLELERGGERKERLQGHSLLPVPDSQTGEVWPREQTCFSEGLTALTQAAFCRGCAGISCPRACLGHRKSPERLKIKGLSAGTEWGLSGSCLLGLAGLL